MRRGPVMAAALVTGALALSGARAAPRPDAPPLAHTGGFGEPTCRACHSDGEPLGAADGSFAITGMPARYEAGRTYEVHLALERPGLRRAGFEMAVRFAPREPSAALQAGLLAPGDPARAAVERDTLRAVQYAHHTRAGTLAPDRGRVAWVVRWTAPRAGGAVVVHAVAVAANDDDSSYGDEVYARALVVPAAP